MSSNLDSHSFTNNNNVYSTYMFRIISTDIINAMIKRYITKIALKLLAY